MNDSELDQLLRSMRDEELPAASLAAVRTGVRERLRARRRFWFAAPAGAKIWAPAAVAALAGLAFVVGVPQLRPVRGPEVARRAPAVPEMVFRRGAASVVHCDNTVKSPVAHREDAAISALARGKKAVKPPFAHGEVTVTAHSVTPPEERTEFVKIFTDDPDVVILWALNTKGE